MTHDPRCGRAVFLLRGNHETWDMNSWEEHFGDGCFLRQCKAKFGPEGGAVWTSVNNAFDCLPLAATIDRAVFCTHGGIPRPPLPPHAPADAAPADAAPADAAAAGAAAGAGEHLPPADRLAAIKALPRRMGVAPARAEELAWQVRLANDLMWADPAEPAMLRTRDPHGFCESSRGGDLTSFTVEATRDFLREVRHPRACSC